LLKIRAHRFEIDPLRQVIGQLGKKPASRLETPYWPATPRNGVAASAAGGLPAGLQFFPQPIPAGDCHNNIVFG
jgi:hypothetical protein